MTKIIERAKLLIFLGPWRLVFEFIEISYQMELNGAQELRKNVPAFQEGGSTPALHRLYCL